MKKIALSNIVWKEGKDYVSLCLNNDISSFGKTKIQALKNLQEALELYYEDNIPTKNLVEKIKRPELVTSIFTFSNNYAKVFAD